MKRLIKRDIILIRWRSTKEVTDIAFVEKMYVYTDAIRILACLDKKSVLESDTGVIGGY